MKIVINSCYGGFGLSREALDMYCAEKGLDPGEWNRIWKFYANINHRDIARDDDVLIRIVECLGAKANGECADLKIVEIPDDVNWYVEEYDGFEHIAERHRIWS